MLVGFGFVKLQGIEILENAGDGDVVLVENVGNVFEVLRRWEVLDTVLDENVLRRIPIDELRLFLKNSVKLRQGVVFQLDLLPVK